VVAGLFALASFGVRRAMQQRRARAERAWSNVAQCVLGAPLAATEASATRLLQVRRAMPDTHGVGDWPRACAGPARAAQRAVLELPEHARRELELAAALGEVAEASEGASDARLASALARVLDGGSTLGWHVGTQRGVLSAPSPSSARVLVPSDPP
jgi:hypothetical protein